MEKEYFFENETIKVKPVKELHKDSHARKLEQGKEYKVQFVLPDDSLVLEGLGFIIQPCDIKKVRQNIPEDTLVTALITIIVECPNPQLPYGRIIVATAQKALEETLGTIFREINEDGEIFFTTWMTRGGRETKIKLPFTFKTDGEADQYFADIFGEDVE